MLSLFGAQSIDCGCKIARNARTLLSRSTLRAPRPGRFSQRALDAPSLRYPSWKCLFRVCKTRVAERNGITTLGPCSNLDGSYTKLLQYPSLSRADATTRCLAMNRKRLDSFTKRIREEYRSQRPLCAFTYQDSRSVSGDVVGVR